MRKYNLPNNVQKRLNVAGVQIDNHTGWFEIDDMLCPDFNLLLCAFFDTKQDFTFLVQTTPDFNSYRRFKLEIEQYSNNSRHFSDRSSKPNFSSGVMIKARCISAQMEQKLNEFL